MDAGAGRSLAPAARGAGADSLSADPQGDGDAGGGADPPRALDVDEAEAAFAWGGYVLHLCLFGGFMDRGTKVVHGASPWDVRELVQEIHATAWGPAVEQAMTLRGSGWVVVVYDYEDGQVRALDLPDHDLDGLGTSWPLITMDCWEHAWIADRGAQGRRDWLLASLRRLHWGVVEYRLREALSAAEVRG